MTSVTFPASSVQVPVGTTDPTISGGIVYRSDEDVFRANQNGNVRNFGAFPFVIVQPATDENGLSQPMVIGPSGEVLVDTTGKIVNSKAGTVGAFTSTAGIQEAFTANNSVLVTKGSYNITSDMTLPEGSNLYLEAGVSFVWNNHKLIIDSIRRARITYLGAGNSSDSSVTQMPNIDNLQISTTTNFITSVQIDALKINSLVVNAINYSIQVIEFNNCYFYLSALGTTISGANQSPNQIYFDKCFFEYHDGSAYGIKWTGTLGQAFFDHCGFEIDSSNFSSNSIFHYLPGSFNALHFEDSQFYINASSSQVFYFFYMDGASSYCLDFDIDVMYFENEAVTELVGLYGGTKFFGNISHVKAVNGGATCYVYALGSGNFNPASTTLKLIVYDLQSNSSTNLFATNDGSGYPINNTTKVISLKNVDGISYQNPSSITVGTSPFTYTNNDPFDEQIVISGGTLSTVQLQRGSTTANSVAGDQIIYLKQGDSIVVTYTAAPTMEKFPL